jgi:hypothetical protein
VRKAFRATAGKSNWKETITCTDDASELIEKLRTMMEEDLNGDSIHYLTKKIELLTEYIQGASPKMSFKQWEDGLQY